MEPLEGIDLMQSRRNVEKLTDLCSGPGKLCMALGITREHSGADLTCSPLYIEEGSNVPKSQIMVSPRINIDYAGEWKDRLWRFYLKDSPFVSKVQKRYRDEARVLLSP